MKRNPFRIIREWATAIFVVAFLIGAGAFFTFMIVDAVVTEGVNILWQFPLFFGVLAGVVFLIYFMGSLIANLWRNAERRWERKHEEP